MEQKIQVPAYLKIGKIITYAMYIWILFGIIMLGMRVFLLAFSANDTTPFVKFVYDTSGSFLQPFRGIFPPRSLNDTGYLDVAALFAMIIYGLIGWGFSALTSYIQSKIDAYTERAKAAEAARQKQLQQQQQRAAGSNGTVTVTSTKYVTRKPNSSNKNGRSI